MTNSDISLHVNMTPAVARVHIAWSTQVLFIGTVHFYGLRLKKAVLLTVVSLFFFFFFFNFNFIVAGFVCLFVCLFFHTVYTFRFFLHATAGLSELMFIT